MNPAPPPSSVNLVRGWRRALLWPLGTLARLWGASLRFELSPTGLRHLRTVDQPVAIILWHNRLFLGAEVFRRYRQGRPTYALVSASKDGAWLDAFFGLVGMRTVRGSSQKLGREALFALIDVLRAGHDIGITPDGPRGPIYEFKAGGLIVTRRTRVPILLLGGAFESGWRLRSWDRFWLPRPFSRVRLYCQRVDPDALEDREASVLHLQERLRQMSPDGVAESRWTVV